MKRSREPEEDSDAPSPVSDDHRESNPQEDETAPRAKIVGLDPSSAVSEDRSSVEMRCSLPGHREVLVFKTYDEFDSHYNKDHSHRCLECRKNFPSGHLLNLHHEESHDPLLAVKREQGEHTYSCFVEGCDRKCRTPQKRRMHLIDKHMYPKNFFFAVTAEGVDGRRSMLLEGGHRRRRSSTATKQQSRRSSLIGSGNAELGARPASEGETEPIVRHDETKGTQEIRSDKPDVVMDDLVGAMSSLQFVPRSIRFGRGGKAGFAKG